MLEEALEKVHAGECPPTEMSGPIVSIAEGDLPVLDPCQRTVGDGDAKDVAAQVVEDLLAAPGVLAVHDPGRRPNRWGNLVEQAGALEGGADRRPEDLRQGADRDEIAPVRRGDPRGAIGGEPPGGDEQMDVRMVPEIAGPRMQDRQTAEPPSHISDIAGEREEGRRRALHQ